MAFGIGDVKFIDSFQLMASSLETLAENLITKSTDKSEMFENLEKQFNADELELVMSNQFMDNIDKIVYPKVHSTNKCYSSSNLSS